MLLQFRVKLWIDNDIILTTTVHLKEVHLLICTRGYRLAWSRIPSLYGRYMPGALAVVGSNPTGPTIYMDSNT